MSESSAMAGDLSKSAWVGAWSVESGIECRPGSVTMTEDERAAMALRRANRRE